MGNHPMADIPKTLRLGWVGFHQEGEQAFKGLIESGHVIRCAVTLEPAALRQRSGWISYAALCKEIGIPLREVSNINEASVLEWLRGFELDILLVIGWSQILKPALLSIPRLATIGAHASLLPELRGSAPINWAIIRGMQHTGNSLILLTDKVDEGRILDQEPFPITPFDTCASLYQKVAETNRIMLLRTLPKLTMGQAMPGFDQPSTSVPNLPRRRPGDGRIRWGLTGAEIYDLIRAVTEPYPGAFTFLSGKKLTVWKAAMIPSVENTKAGTIIGRVVATEPAACGQLVACGDGYGILMIDVEFTGGLRLTGHELAKQNWTGITLE